MNDKTNEDVDISDLEEHEGEGDLARRPAERRDRLDAVEDLRRVHAYSFGGSRTKPPPGFVRPHTGRKSKARGCQYTNR